MQSHVEISVADTGEGISPDFLPHLFERFSQADGSAERKHRGLGLGLSLVQNLVEMHGGAVRVNSRSKEPRSSSAFPGKRLKAARTRRTRHIHECCCRLNVSDRTSEVSKCSWWRMRRTRGSS